MNKKIMIMLTLFLWVSMVNVFADNLNELDALLNDSGIATGDTTTGNITTEVITWNVVNTTSWSVTLSFDKVGDYTDYKVYYSKTDDPNNVQEQEVKLNELDDSKQVTISWLDSDTEYQFVIKAFDNDWNPVESTSSDSIKAKTKIIEQDYTAPDYAAPDHAAPADNVIYNPVLKVDWSKIIVSYKPWVDVEKVQISLSKDGKVFKTLTTLDSTKTTYTINTEITGKKYVKLVPISKDGTLWVCKVWASKVDFVTANVEPKIVAKKVMWKPKTGPETYLLVLLAIFVYAVYAVRKQKA